MLKLLTLQDVPALFSIIDQHRDDLRIWMDWVDEIQTADDLWGDMQLNVPSLNRYYGIYQQDQLVGMWEVHHVDEVRETAELGYWLIPPARGHHLITQTLPLLRKQLTDFQRLELRCHPQNVAGIAVAKKLGAYEGLLKDADNLHDQRVDMMVFRVIGYER